MKRGLLLAFTFVLGLLFIWQFSRSRTLQLTGEIIDRVDTERRLVCLTFDDGPSGGFTENILEVLESLEIKGTFFLVGEQMKNHPELTRLIVAGGHEVGNHSFSHSRMVFVSYEEVAREVETTNQLIREAGYEGEIRFRPPYGKKLFNLPRYLAQNGILTVTWDLEPETHVDASNPRLIADYVVRNVRPGSIILLHVMFESRSASLRAVPIIVKELVKQGYSFVTVSQLVAEKS